MHHNINKITNALQAQGYDCYLVGGCVRDMIMENVPHDYDFCTNARPIDIIHALERHQISYHTIGMQYGTIVALLDSSSYEITTYRKEQNYTEGRHPDFVSFTDSLTEDLSRRDFTMNAMAYDANTRKVIDPFGGVRDIQNHMLRCVGDADKRIKEDGLRILRAIRFAIKYDMEMDDALKAAIHKNVSMLDKVSKERITEELRKILTCTKPIAKVFVEFSDVIAHIFPELTPCIGFDQNNKYHKHNVYEHILAVVDNCKTEKFEIKLAALLHDIGKPAVCFRGEDGYNHFHGHAQKSVEISKQVFENDLVMTNSEKELVLELVEYHDAQVAGTEKSVRRFIARHGFDFLDDWVMLRQADRDDHIYPDKKNEQFYTNIPEICRIKQQLLKQKTCFSFKDLAVNGNDLMKAFRLAPSPLLGKILQFLLDEVIDGNVSNEKETLLAKAEEWMERDPEREIEGELSLIL